MSVSASLIKLPIHCFFFPYRLLAFPFFIHFIIFLFFFFFYFTRQHHSPPFRTPPPPPPGGHPLFFLYIYTRGPLFPPPLLALFSYFASLLFLSSLFQVPSFRPCPPIFIKSLSVFLIFTLKGEAHRVDLRDRPELPGASNRSSVYVCVSVCVCVRVSLFSCGLFFLRSNYVVFVLKISVSFSLVVYAVVILFALGFSVVSVYFQSLKEICVEFD